MATLTGQTIASSYEQLLSLPDGGGNTTTLVAVTDGDAGTTFAMQLSTTTLCIDNPTASSSTQGGILRLQSDDGNVMASGHRLGVIEFGGAENTSNTITTGARIEALADATWSATENGADMVFYTTDGNASQSEVMRLTADAGTEFTGDVAVKSGGTTIGTLKNSSSDWVLTSAVQDKDIIFKGDDGGTAITAMKLDMSESGAVVLSTGVQAIGPSIRGKQDGTEGQVGISDDATVTFEIPTPGGDGGSCLLLINETNAGSGLIAGCTKASGTVTEISDPDGAWNVTDADGNSCVFKSSTDATVTIKNRNGSDREYGWMIISS
jgi:hypothetical protein